MVRKFILGSTFLVLLALPLGILSTHAFGATQLADSEDPDDTPPDPNAGKQRGDTGQQRQTCEIKTMSVAKNVCVSKTAVMEVCTGEPPEFRRCL